MVIASDAADKNNQGQSAKIKYDWYETISHVIVIVLAQNATNVNVYCADRVFSVTAKQPNGGDYRLELNLAHCVVPDEYIQKVTSTKIEIKLRKQKDVMWGVLEGNSENAYAPISHPTESQALRYPTSSKKPKDWNKIEKEITKEEAEIEKEHGLNIAETFQRLYDSSSDPARRAMAKSFQESGGTVLSTDWNEVGSSTVERRAPQGFEWKSLK